VFVEKEREREREREREEEVKDDRRHSIPTAALERNTASE